MTCNDKVSYGSSPLCTCHESLYFVLKNTHKQMQSRSRPHAHVHIHPPTFTHMSRYGEEQVKCELAPTRSITEMRAGNLSVPRLHFCFARRSSSFVFYYTLWKLCLQVSEKGTDTRPSWVFSFFVCVCLCRVLHAHVCVGLRRSMSVLVYIFKNVLVHEVLTNFNVRMLIFSTCIYIVYINLKINIDSLEYMHKHTRTGMLRVSQHSHAVSTRAQGRSSWDCSQSGYVCSHNEHGWGWWSGS